MDIQKLDIEYGDVVVLTYGDTLDLDEINTHYEAIKDLLHNQFGCIVIPNRIDFIKDITIIKDENGGLPFR